MVRAIARRALLFGIPAAVLFLVVGPVSSRLFQTVAVFALGAASSSVVSMTIGARRERRYEEWATALVEREAMQNVRAASLPLSTFGTQEYNRDPDGWPVPLTRRLTDTLVHPEPASDEVEYVRLAALAREAVLPVYVEPDEFATPAVGVASVERVGESDWARRSIDAFVRLGRRIEGEPLRVRLDRALSSPRLDWFFVAMDRLREWLAAHEVTFWTVEPGEYHAAHAAPPPQIIRWIDDEPDDFGEPIALRYDMDAQWSLEADEAMIAELLTPVGVS